MHAHVQITAERGKDFARREVLESAAEGRKGGLRVSRGHLLTPTHSQDPSRRGDNGETLPAAARLDRDYEVITA